MAAFSNGELTKQNFRFIYHWLNFKEKTEYFVLIIKAYKFKRHQNNFSHDISKLLKLFLKYPKVKQINNKHFKQKVRDQTSAFIL